MIDQACKQKSEHPVLILAGLSDNIHSTSQVSNPSQSLSNPLCKKKKKKKKKNRKKEKTKRRTSYRPVPSPGARWVAMLRRELPLLTRTARRPVVPWYASPSSSSGTPPCCSDCRDDADPLRDRVPDAPMSPSTASPCCVEDHDSV